MAYLADKCQLYSNSFMVCTNALLASSYCETCYSSTIAADHICMVSLVVPLLQ